MRNPFVHGPGGILSADIAVPEHQREVEFYSKVLTTGADPLWNEDLMNNLGKPIIGLGERVPEYEFLPLQWMPHFQVADVAASAQAALDLGGKEIMHSKTDDGQSQWAALFDTDGAAFGIIPAVSESETGIDANERQGRIAWLSLAVSDVSKTCSFYQRVLGWNPNGDQAAEGEMLLDDGNAAAEIVQFQDSTNIPSIWLLYLPVGDFAESLQKVSENGGQVIHQCSESNSAVVRDPVGAVFAIQQD